MVPAVVFFVVPVMFVRVSVCEVDPCPWYKLVVRVCVERVGANEGRKWKIHYEVEARLMLRPQRA